MLRNWLAVAVLAAAACEPVEPARSPVPPARPPEPAAERPAEPSALSRELAESYAGIERSLRARGLLRTDAGDRDAPFSQAMLVENFVRVALYEEYASVGGRLVPRQTASRLHRWEQPVRLQVEFGDSVGEIQRARDRREIGRYRQRLSELTGLPMRIVSAGGNFHVFIVNEDERRALGPRLRQIVPGLSSDAVRTVVDLPPESYCLVFAVDPASTGRYSQAVAIIRAEHPDLLRLSCIHEELAQGMGLANDSPKARPSVFNDDEEFALLTRHDELLLRILYDRRLRAGMTEAQARPIVETIVAELMDTPPS